MDLGSRQSRGLFLAGTVPFPAPYPSTGTIALDNGQLVYSQGQPAHATDLVLVLEFDRNETIVRMMRQDDVSAIFIPGTRDAQGTFHISQAAHVGNVELGEWFLDGDVNAGEIRQRLNLNQEDDISTRNSILRGIVFVAEDRPIMRITEVFYLAGADEELVKFPCCTCHWGGEYFPTMHASEDFRNTCTPC
jgi:hypothetical protein